MIKATTEFLQAHEALCENRKQEIRNTPDRIVPTGRVFYVSADGNDENDGCAPERAWKTLRRVTDAALLPGDTVRLRRGDIFRGQIKTKPGVTYCAYGEGEKPRIYSWDKNLADPALWSLHDAEHHIWKLNEKILDCGTLVFNEGEAHSRKQIPSYRGGIFVCRNDESLPFDMARDMDKDLDIVCFYEERMNEKETKGECFPVPVIDEESYGDLYLRCDRGNPGEVFASIEAPVKRRAFLNSDTPNVTIDNICIKYVGSHAISAGRHVVGLHVSNCEIGWIGGTIQHYFGTDPNYVEGRRGSVTRYGNGVEIYGGCEDYRVENCYFYQIYDAAITHQISTRGKKYTLTGIHYLNNLVEHCVYSIEYFLEREDGDTESYIDGCEIAGNILRFSGYGWGQQRHNTHTPAHIKGWSYENTASNFSIHDNIFDRAAYRMLHLVAKKPESCAEMHGNTYIQTLGNPLGQYGANEIAEPPVLTFDENAERTITEVFGDRGAQVYYIR